MVRGPRARALLVDTIVLAVASLVINNIYGVAHIVAGSPSVVGGGFSFSTSTTGVDWPWITLVWLIYFTVPEALFGATPGKLFVGLRVVRLDSAPLGVRAVLTRNLVRLVDFLPFLYLLGGVSVFATSGSQRVGDLVAGTTVVAHEHASEPGATRTAGMTARRTVLALLGLAVAVSLGFDYLGRPPLVIEGAFNTGQLPINGVPYELGSPNWTLGQVTYPITQTDTQRTCTGSVTLDWEWSGWNVAGSAFTCSP